jgi:hypothetical protein
MVGSGSGGLRLLVQRDGYAWLMYGALMGIDVKPGVFHIDELYAGLYGGLMDLDACRRDIPWLRYDGTYRQIYDSVRLDFEDGSREEYCTHDSAFTNRVLIRACENLTESAWHTAGDVYDRACGELTGQAP